MPSKNEERGNVITKRVVTREGSGALLSRKTLAKFIPSCYNIARAGIIAQLARVPR
jgi:hypothetical protein